MTLSKQNTCPKGTVRLEIAIEAEIPAEEIICHWTKHEVAALVAGDKEARQELVSQAGAYARDSSDFEVDDVEIEIEGRRL